MKAFALTRILAAPLLDERVNCQGKRIRFRAREPLPQHENLRCDGRLRSIDVAKITCKQFITYEITDDARTLSLWLAGYWNGQQKNTLVDVSRFRRRSDALKDYCLSHFDTPLLDAPKTVVETTR